MLGYTTSSSDDTMITYISNKVINDIETNANITEIPSSAENQVTDIIVGEFLQSKKATGADLGAIDSAIIANSIDIGDTSIDFGKVDSDKALDNLLAQMIGYNFTQVVASLRRFDWGL